MNEKMNRWASKTRLNNAIHRVTFLLFTAIKELSQDVNQEFKAWEK